MFIKKTVPCLIALALVGSVGCGMKKQEAEEPAMMEEPAGMEEGMMKQEAPAEEMPADEEAPQE